MKIAAGGLVRTTTGLNLRSEPRVAAGNILATAAAGALLHPLGAPLTGSANGWVQVEVWGWATGVADRLYFEPDELSGVKARVIEPAALLAVSTTGAWRFVKLAGYVSTGFVSVVDGP